jgi:BirA family transcriptional regulator, biotin operon repressor / biotin---[acetyl-CoA-carboxylase] ligase
VVVAAPIRHFKAIDSTNLEAARLNAAGETGPLWILADAQQSGKGRLGRSWHSPQGNLYCTLLMPTEALAGVVPQLGFVVALAVNDTVSKFCVGRRVSLKWPNDCLLDGGKVAGILCEALSGGHIAIGCGINIDSCPEGLDYATSRINAHAATTVAAVFAHYRQQLDHRLVEWQSGLGFGHIAAAWEARAGHLNEVISVRQHNVLKVGRFLGLAADGAMRLQKPDGLVETVYAGDVTMALRMPRTP